MSKEERDDLESWLRVYLESAAGKPTEWSPSLAKFLAGGPIPFFAYSNDGVTWSYTGQMAFDIAEHICRDAQRKQRREGMNNQEKRDVFIQGWIGAWLQLPSYDQALRLAKAEAERLYPDVPETDALSQLLEACEQTKDEKGIPYISPSLTSAAREQLHRKETNGM